MPTARLTDTCPTRAPRPPGRPGPVPVPFLRKCRLPCAAWKREVTQQPAPAEYPNLPRLLTLEGGYAPQAPATLADTGIDQAVLADLVLKVGYTTPNFTTEW